MGVVLKMKIKVITPVISDIFNEEVRKEFNHYASTSTEVSVSNLEYGPSSIESEFDEALCILDFLEKAKQAEEEGYDGVISNCFGDPGVRPAREILDIPVVGAGESSMLFASLLADTFSVMCVLPNVLTINKNISKALGVSDNVASFRSVDIPVLKVNEKEKLTKVLFDEMVLAIEEDQAHALILGCTGMMGVAKNLQSILKDKGYDVPVIDPAYAATKMLENVISMGLKQSRLTYMAPPDKKYKLPYKTGFCE